VAIPDNLPAGVNIPVVVSQACTVTDLNFRIDGTAGIADPLSAAVGVNHSWVGDLTFKLTSPSGTAVTMIDRPGVPASTSGCNSNNLSAITLDDDGAFPPIENQCGTGDNAAFPSGTFLPNNLLSAFDGQGALGTWMLNVSDSANQDTGSVRAFTLVISCAGVVPTPTPTVAPSPTPTVAPSPTPTPTPVSCSFAANPTSRSFTSAGGTGTFTVVTGPTCQWTASDFVDWVTITAGSNGTGQQTVTYTVSPNTSTTARSTTIDFGGVGGLAEHAITQSGAAAPSPTPTATVAPSPSPTPTVAPSPTPTATPMIRDGGFERTAANGSNPDWGTTSTTFGTSLCTLDCGTSAAVTPRGGSGWVWFDGATSGAAAEQGTVSQTVTIAPGSTATLTFYMKIAVVRAPTSSVMTVTVDGTVVQTFQEPATAETAYTLRTIDLTPFANGQPRLLSFNYSRPAGATGSDSFLIDDVELQAVTGPTTASMTGRVTTPTGTNLRNVVVSLINEQGVRTTATTSSFGIFSFTGVPTGRTYTMTVASRRYRFAAKTIPLTGNMTNVDFVGLE
jgi:subtilisin-like proprotein convertase family protein